MVLSMTRMGEKRIGIRGVHEMGSPRISSTLRFGTRTDRDQGMQDKIRSVEAKLRT